jgi:hypothetical protein
MYATAAPPVFSAVDVKSPGQLGDRPGPTPAAREPSWSVLRGCANAPAGESGILQLEVRLSQKPKTPR